MTLLQMQVILQALTSLAVVGSLLFAAAQLLHWRRAYQVMNFTKLVELQMMLRKMRVDDPSLARIYKDDMLGVKDDDEVRADFFNLMQLSVFEIAWYSRRLGQLSDDYFRSWEKRMRHIQQEESFRRMMSRPSMKILHDDFQKYVEETMRAQKNGG